MNVVLQAITRNDVKKSDVTDLLNVTENVSMVQNASNDTVIK